MTALVSAPPAKTICALSVVIVTYGRDRVLVETISHLLDLPVRAAEILVVDQTQTHDMPTQQQLSAWNDTEDIRWLVLSKPSIPAAMNRGLLEAAHDVVLYVDDDIVPSDGLVATHYAAHAAGAGLVAGRVLQPWDDDVPSATWQERQFASTHPQAVDRFIGCNFSVSRLRALALGGFDENFVRVAYNYEREFADRWRAAGGTIQFNPVAQLRHLKAAGGGTRTFGEHLRTLLPAHSVGAYYFLLRTPLPVRRWRSFFWRPLRAVMTRHHARHPWWIPLTLISELGGMLWAAKLYTDGPRFIMPPISQSRG